MSSYAALITLALCHSITLPCGKVRRSSIHGFTFADGVTLDLDEAAVRAAVPATRPALVRLEGPAVEEVVVGLEIAVTPAPEPAAELGMMNPYRLPSGELVSLHDHCTGARESFQLRDGSIVLAERMTPTAHHDVPRLDVAVDDAAPANDVEQLVAGATADDTAEPVLCPCGGIEGGRPCAPCVEVFAAEVDATAFDGPEPIAEEDLPAAQVTVCDRCAGQKRSRKAADACMRCLGRGVRIWVANIEMVRNPPRTDGGRIAAAYALSDALRELPDSAIKGAHELLGVALEGADPATRAKALEQWAFAQRRRAEES